MTKHEDTQLLYYTRSQRIIGLIVFTLSLIPALFVVLLAFSDEFAFWRLVPGMVIMAALLMLIYRGSTANLKITDSGLEVRNVLRSHTLDWADIAKVKLGAKRFTLFSNAAVVELTDHTEIVVFAIQQTLADIREGESSKTNQLVAEIEKVRQSAITDQPGSD